MAMPKLQSVLKCIQNQFATERERAVIDTLKVNVESELLHHQFMETRLMEENYVPVGLFNNGNTCYANSAIQSLLVCVPFTGYFVDQFMKLDKIVQERHDIIANLQENNSLRSKKTLSYLSVEFGNVIWSLLLLHNQYDSFSPHKLMAHVRRIYPQFSLGSQHDAQEFISCLLDRLHEELKYPVFQLAEETNEEDEEGTTSTKSDYESCVSLVSEDSNYHLNGVDDTLMGDGLCNGYANMERHNGPVYMDCDSVQDSAVCEAGDEYFESASVENLDDEMGELANISCTSETTPEPTFMSVPRRYSKIVTWKSIIQDLFYGDFAVSIECKACSEISTRYESFQMLEVSIPTSEQLAELSDSGLEGLEDDDSFPRQKPNRSDSQPSRWPKWLSLGLKSSHSRRRIDLMTCLKNEFRPEHLVGDNQYHCDHCNKQTDAVKNIRISRLPEILIIHLKRFKYENSGAFLSSFTNPDRKIHDLVDFPCDDLLDPTMFNVDFTTKYELRSVIAHSGSTLSSGHYTCFVKTRSHASSKWFMCNDTDVSEVSSSVIADTEAYMLFYSRRDDEKFDRLSELRDFISHTDLPEVKSDCMEVISPRSTTLVPPGIFHRYEENVPLISREWWSKLKWSNVVHRISSHDFLCPHRMLLPGTTEHLEDICLPVHPLAFEKILKLFDGVNCHLSHKMECFLCAQMFHKRPNASGHTKLTNKPNLQEKVNGSLQ